MYSLQEGTERLAGRAVVKVFDYKHSKPSFRRFPSWSQVVSIPGWSPVSLPLASPHC